MRISDWSSDVCSSDLRIDRTLGKTACGKGAKPALSQFRQCTLGEDRARGIAGAQKQDIINAVRHEKLRQQQGISSAISGSHSSALPPQQSLTRNRVSALSWSRSAR